MDIANIGSRLWKSGVPIPVATVKQSRLVS